MNRSNTEDFMAGIHHEQNQQKTSTYSVLGVGIRGGADILSSDHETHEDAKQALQAMYDDPFFDPGNWQDIIIRPTGD